MTLVPGTRLGAYEILSAIGAGGMGEVYRARDTKLGRDVALKILPDLFALDPERRARFEREAKTLAALNHTHIAHIYGFEQTDATSALVMELVEGEDLAQRIARGPIPVDEAIAIAKQIADGLEAAHEQGIVHRDLKPANVKLRPDGTVKVLDFGLAKAAAPRSALDAANSPTFTRLRQGFGEAGSPTQLGVIIGTAAYMAPEQARGKVVDKRADIWAFGCVLYEMLTGRRAFGADNVTDTLAVIVKGDPDWTALPPTTPPALRELLAQTLVKDPRLRLRDIGDARIVLDRLAGGASEEPVGSAVDRAQARRFGMLHVVGAAAAFAVAASVVTWWALHRVQDSPPPLARFVTPLGQDVSPVRSAGAGVAFSRDGRSVVYVGQPMLLSSPVLYRRKLSALDVERLPGTEGAYAPFFSPDGRWIGFFTDKAVMKIPVEGGAVSKISDRGTYARAAWASNDTIILGAGILFAPGALGRVSAAGGAPEPLTTLSGKETLHTHPHVLPDGRHVVFTLVSPDRSEIAIAPIEGGPHRRLGLEGSVPMFAAPSHLLIARDGSLFAAPFDVRRLGVTGTPMQVFEDAAVFSAARPGIGRLWVPVAGVDAVGSIAYLNKGGSPTVLGWMTSHSALEEIALPPGEYGPPRLSPDGRRAAVTIGEAPDIWVLDLERGTRLRLTSSGASDPVWSPDGLRIAYRTAQGILSIAADGSGQPESMLSKRERMVMFPTSWSSDRKTIAATAEAEGARGARNRDIWIVRAGAQPVPLLASPADESGGALSPDGRWLAYASSVSGREEVYVRAVDGSGAMIPVSRDGGTLPMWSAAADAIFFQASGPRLLRASFTDKPFDVGPAALTVSLPATTGGVDVTADGRFLVLYQKQETAARDALHVLLNWGPSLR